MKASIVVIGNEILNGRVTDTNSGWLARQLDAHGIETDRIITVGDNSEDIANAVMSVLSPDSIIFTTGGLGPTKDDITKLTLNRILGDGELYTSNEVLDHVTRIMTERGREMNDLTATQALVPRCAQIIMNQVGTAPGLLFEYEGAKVFCMPGVPFEMRHIFTNSILPLLGVNEGWYHHFLKVWGISESALAEYLDEFEKTLEGRLAYLPDGGVVTLRLDCKSESSLIEYSKVLKVLLDDKLLGEGDVPIASLLLDALKQKKYTVATAESCTGGEIVHNLTVIPGASEVVMGGVVAYNADVKVRVLGVDRDSIEQFGVVSSQVAEQMAEGVCKTVGADMGIATTGIAGPTGAEPGRPVGTVWMAWCIKGKTISRCFHFPGNRRRVIDMATNTAIATAIQLMGKSSD